jgi:hypothetical protein
LKIKEILIQRIKNLFSKNKKFVFDFKIFSPSIKIYLLAFFIFSLGYFPLSLVLLRIQTIDSSLKNITAFLFFFLIFSLSSLLFL